MSTIPVPHPRWSIRRKLSLVTTGVTLFALALLGASITTYEWYNFRDTLNRELLIQADIIGANSVVALSFEALDGDMGGKTDLVTDFDASDTLQTLRANRHVVLACIYSKSNEVLAKYAPSDGRSCPSTPGPTGSTFSDDSLTVIRPIVEPDGETVGIVHLESDLQELYAGIKDRAVIITGVALACLLIAFVLSVWLQNRISSPVLNLARTAAKVSENRDYSIRAKGQSQDEVGQLVTAFNEMLVTIQKRDDELRILSSSLEEKVKQRTADLASAMEEARDARDRALKASQAKSQFLANMSHEIRTPLNAIIGLTNLGLRAKPSAKIGRYLTKVTSSSRTLLAIINDILDFSKIEAHRLDLVSSDFDLRALMANLTDVIGEAALAEGIEFLVSIGADIPSALRGDALRLEQVLTNLAANAVKFTKQGTVLVKVALVEESDEHATLTFTVKDTGIGISKEMIPKLFDSFAQADDSMTRRYGGTGLGLSISQRLVGLMGGEIGVDSEEGKGSTFSFTLKLEKQPRGNQTRYRPSKELVGTRALIVDDNEYAREILMEALTSFSFECEAVSSGGEAIDELARASEAGRPYELVLLDWRMPGLDGIETARRMERDPRIQATMPKVLMVSAHGREEVITQAEDAGLDGFLVKPVSYSTLFDAVMEAFGQDVVKEEVRNEHDDAAEEEVQALRGARILLAEDIEINQEIVREILNRVGVSPVVVSDGEQAVRALVEQGEQGGSFDAVLMDLQMPGMDGYEATRAIRKDPRFADLPIIALTAHATVAHRKSCLAAGMNDHVTKPIDDDELLSVLAQWIGPRQGAALEEAPASTSFVVPRPSSDRAVLPDLLAGVNLGVALKRMSGNQVLLRQLLVSFVAKYGQSASELEQALRRGDREAASRLAHSLKGLAGNLGAEAVYQRALEVERAIKADANDAEQQLGALEQALSEIVQSVGALDDLVPAEVEQSRERPGGSSDEPPLGADLIVLLKLLGANHLNARSKFESLKRRLAVQLEGTNELAQIEQIEQQINQLDFKKARASLAHVAARLGVEI